MCPKPGTGTKEPLVHVNREPLNLEKCAAGERLPVSSNRQRNESVMCFSGLPMMCLVGECSQGVRLSHTEIKRHDCRAAAMYSRPGRGCAVP